MEHAPSSNESKDHRQITPETCLHCRAPVSGGGAFCCTGCEAAHHAAGQMGMNTGFSAFAKPTPDGGFSLMLAVKGIHCASCIRLIENALHAQEDVSSARVNMSTARLSISWQGDKNRADALATIVDTLGYRVSPFDTDGGKRAAREHESFLLRCIAVSGFAMGNLMMISVGLWASDAETMGIATQDFFYGISALIALPAILYAGRPFFASALAALKERRTNMDVPISLAVLLACGMSIVEALHRGEYIYFDSAVMLVFFLLIGRYLDARAKGKARESAGALLSMLHGSATVIENGISTAVPIRELRKGMDVFVAAGENIPADGTVTDGVSDTDVSLITGETLPVTVQQGDTVFAGTVNISAPLRLTVSNAGDDSLLSDIVKLMEKAEQGQARYVRLADKAARLYTPVVHVMALLTFIGWFFLSESGWQPALLHAVTVLIITCPCALGLAVPVVQVLAGGTLMKQGILLKSGDALEKLAAIDVAIFDKTGTLTLGKPALSTHHHTDTHLQLAASVAVHSKHPLSQALCRAYDGTLLPAERSEELPGKGVQSFIDGRRIRVGSRAWCGSSGNATSHAGLELWLNVAGEPPVLFAFSDPLRDDAADVVAAFHTAGVNTILLSGDRHEAVAHVAQTLGITDYHAALTPTEKCAHLEHLKAEGRHILMAGDGLNDAPSLAAADVSLSPSTAIDITQNTADIVFQGERLFPVIAAWRTAIQANILVKQNFMLATLYNMVAIPLAVAGYVTPLIAAIAMSGSSLIVIGNSFRLRRHKKG